MNRVIKFSCLFVILVANTVRSIAQDECGNNALVAAEKRYDIGKLIECINGLKGCLASGGFDYDEKLQAYRLCAKSYLALDSLAQADTFITKLVAIDDNLQADATDPIRFRLRVAYIRTLMRANLTSSVSKKAENIELAPATIQIITAKEIRDRGYRDLESVFSDLPGFDVSTNFGISYSVIYQRGYRSPALTERTLILIDGVEDNDLWTNAAYITMQYPLSNIKKIEIIYGPASTIYGVNAFSGVINIVTKDEDDVFSYDNNDNNKNNKPKNIALNMQTGYATYNTKYIDGTLSARNKNVFLSVTGRVYTSDGIDLSSQSRWDGIPDYGNAAYLNKMTMNYSGDSTQRYIGPYFYVNKDSTKIIPTTAGIARADSLDKALYKNSKYKNANVFSDPIKDFYVSAKLSVQNFKFGFQFWNKNEGSAGDFVDNYSSVNSAWTNWQIREYFIYAGYDKKLSGHINFSSLTYYAYTDLGDHTRTLKYNGYGNGALKDYDFITGNLPYFQPYYYAQNSNELRSEIKMLYKYNDKFDFLAGTEYSTGIIQANYLTSKIVSPAIIYGTAGDSLGGNNFTQYTISGYLTGSYHNAARKLNVDAGGRLDNNSFKETKGYGTVFNPRIDVVYYPGKFIYKAIYSQAFLDASAQNKFSTVSSRLVPNPSLQPEKVTNYELSARYKLNKKDYIELVGYRAKYTHSIGDVQVQLNGQTTHKFEDIGQSLIMGMQAASEIFLAGNISIRSDFTYCDPKSIYTSTSGKDSAVRTGDIASLSANIGVNVAMMRQKLNVNLRVNLVGDKPTGINTSVPGNPLSKVPGYGLLNATIGYEILKGVLLQAGCNNILNTQYASPGVRTADDISYPSSVPQPLRNYYIKLIASLAK